MKDKIKEAVRVYDKIAAIYVNSSYEKIMQFQLTKFESLLKGKKILDVGCGVGRDVEYFLTDGYDPVGIDASENMIKEAKKNIPEGKFKIMDFRKMDFKDDSFDGIWAMASLYHISEDEMVDTLKEFYRVLGKKGLLYIAVYEGEGSKEDIDPKYGEKRTFYFYKEDDMKKYLEEAGFAVIRSEVNQTEEHRWLEVYARKE